VPGPCLRQWAYDVVSNAAHPHAARATPSQSVDGRRHMKSKTQALGPESSHDEVVGEMTLFVF